MPIRTFMPRLAPSRIYGRLELAGRFASTAPLFIKLLYGFKIIDPIARGATPTL